MTAFRQMSVALARLKPCPVLSFRYLTQGRGRLGFLGYTDPTDAVPQKKPRWGRNDELCGNWKGVAFWRGHNSGLEGFGSLSR